MVLSPTYTMLRDATLRTFDVLARRAGLLREWRAATNTAILGNGAEVLFRTADDPDRLRGPSLGWAWLDEGAYCSAEAWLVLVGRLSEFPGRAWCTTTPRGQNWVWETFVRDAGPEVELIRATTAGNPYLPPQYITSIAATYHGKRAQQELEGEFVDLEGAALFLADRLEVVAVAPAGLPAIRRWDLAATAGGGDWTAGVLLAGPDVAGLYYVLDVRRGQWEVSQRDAIIRQTAGLDGHEVEQRGPQDPGAAGKQAAAAFIRMLSGYSVRTEIETGDKVTRATPYASQVNAGNMRLVRAPWNSAYLEELRSFPSGAFDDQVDASAGAFNALQHGGLDGLVRFG